MIYDSFLSMAEERSTEKDTMKADENEHDERKAKYFA